MTQEMLDRLIGAAPPSTVDVDAVIVRARRGQRLRRLAASGAVATAVAGAVLAGVSLTGGGPAPLPVAEPPPAQPSTTPSVAPSGTGTVVETGTEAGRRRTLEVVREALESATEKHAPGTAWIYMPDVPGEKRLPDGRPNLWIGKDPVSFEGRSGITGDGRKGGFYLSLRPAGCVAGQSCSPLYECDGTVKTCATTRTASGLKLVHWIDKPGRGWVFYGADVALRDGDHALRLQAVNYFGGDGSPTSAKLPVLTRAQLDAIATDIADVFTG
ncbi:hypothetical protein AB0F81_09325 [Actinoplanes sp. NPDC024001]|uniref:hypothetical protein n=1 Tax=Actinoplanes sp. NPDC024001 TaxID=3154598 RepID=UPI0033E86B4A